MINYSRVVSDYSVLNCFDFSFDHRIGRATIKITTNCLFKKFPKEKRRPSKFIIPIHRINDANILFNKKLREAAFDKEGDIQKGYNELEKLILQVEGEVGAKKTSQQPTIN